MPYVAIALALAVAAALLTLRLSIGTITVFEYERGLRFVRGHLKEEVGPGLYRYLRPYTTITKIDARPTTLAMSGQEVLSRDGVAVKASLTATYTIVSVRAVILNANNFAATLHTELQQALRTVVASTDIEQLLQLRAELGPRLLELVQPGVESVGVRLERVAMRDLTMPGDLKKIFAQVVKARQEGLAALERARGETAALRNLANAAQMVERNPHLLQLRLLQVAEQQTNATFVVGMPPGTTAVPLASGQDVGSIPGPKTDHADSD